MWLLRPARLPHGRACPAGLHPTPTCARRPLTALLHANRHLAPSPHLSLPTPLQIGAVQGAAQFLCQLSKGVSGVAGDVLGSQVGGAGGRYAGEAGWGGGQGETADAEVQACWVKPVRD